MSGHGLHRRQRYARVGYVRPIRTPEGTGMTAYLDRHLVTITLLFLPLMPVLGVMFR